MLLKTLNMKKYYLTKVIKNAKCLKCGKITVTKAIVNIKIQSNTLSFLTYLLYIIMYTTPKVKHIMNNNHRI